MKNSLKPSILCVGHACLDIVHYVPNIPEPNTKVADRDFTVQIGGNAANAAAAICDLGGQADLCSVIGNEYHPFTRILHVLCRERGIGTRYCKYDVNSHCPSSTIMVLPDGERAIMSWQSDDIKVAISEPDDIRHYSMVMADTYRLPMVRKVLDRARQEGIPTMLDVDSLVDDILILPKVDNTWFGYESWHHLWRKHRISLPDMQERLGGTVGITNGRNAVSWVGPDKVIRTVYPPTVTPVNTLGAGDVFRARLALGMCINESIYDSVSAACATACQHITKHDLTRIIK